MLQSFLVAGINDLDFMAENLKEFDLDFTDIIDEIKSTGIDVNFNNVIYEIFSQAFNKFKDKVIEYCKNNNIDTESVENFELNIYINYLDSFYNNEELDNIDITDFSENNIKQFLQNLAK